MTSDKMSLLTETFPHKFLKSSTEVGTLSLKMFAHAGVSRGFCMSCATCLAFMRALPLNKPEAQLFQQKEIKHFMIE